MTSGDDLVKPKFTAMLFCGRVKYGVSIISLKALHIQSTLNASISVFEIRDLNQRKLKFSETTYNHFMTLIIS